MDTIHFVHGNGFPSSCYRQILDPLGKKYNLICIERVGHNPDFPVTENWHELVEEVIFNIEQQAKQPVIGLGHSLGGVLTLLAAIERPDLFKTVIMLDSPLLGWLKSTALLLLKKFGMIDKFTPAFQTKGRRKRWNSKDQVIEYLRSRELFKSFSPDCLNDYIEFGLEEDDNGYSLRFDREIESNIYRTIPHILHKYEGRLLRPASLIYGNESNIISRMDLRYIKNKYKVECHEMNGTHMFPMEHPTSCVTLILDLIQKFSGRAQ